MSVTPPEPPIEGWEVLDLLTSLVQKSLVVYEEDEQGRGRYRLLEPTRQYARDRLLEAGEGAAMRGRHRNCFLALAEEAQPEFYGPEPVRWLDRLEAEHDNLRAALAWSVAQDQGEAGLRLGGALGWFWFVRGYAGEGREHLAGLLALPGAGARTAARARALQGAGWLAQNEADYGEARALHAESLAIHRELGDRGGVAGSLINLGIVARDQGDGEAARALFEESLAIRRERGEKSGIAYALGWLGIATSQHGDHGAARALIGESLAILRELGNKSDIAWSLTGLGWAARGQGDNGAARAFFGESLAIGREAGHKPRILQDLEGLAAVAVAQAQSERAARLFGAAERLRQAMGAPLPPVDRAEHDRSVAAVRTALGEEAFAAAWAEGRAMALEQACAYALQEMTEG